MCRNKLKLKQKYFALHERNHGFKVKPRILRSNHGFYIPCKIRYLNAGDSEVGYFKLYFDWGPALVLLSFNTRQTKVSSHKKVFTSLNVWLYIWFENISLEKNRKPTPCRKTWVGDEELTGNCLMLQIREFFSGTYFTVPILV